MFERRQFEVSELRVEGTKEPVITGHAAVFNELSVDLGGFREKIEPGAFEDTIKKDDIRALWNHDPNFILGRNKSGTLKLSEDSKGLKIRISPPDTVFANDILETIKRGDVDQMSFGFRVLPDGDEWEMMEEQVIRTLIKVTLYDVSPVTFAAYPQTDVKARLDGVNAEIRSYYEEKIAEIKKNDGNFADEKAKSAVADDPDKIVVPAEPVPTYADAIRRARWKIEEDEQQRFLRQSKERARFIADRSPKPNPFSYAEALKKSKLTL